MRAGDGSTGTGARNAGESARVHALRELVLPVVVVVVAGDGQATSCATTTTSHVSLSMPPSSATEAASSQLLPTSTSGTQSRPCP
jgi:hypothetical protein